MKSKIALLLSTAFFLTACANTPNLGEKMMNQSNDTKELATKWKQGEQLIVSGKSLQSKGNKLISKGKDQISDGNKLISKGNENVNSGNKMLSEGQRQTAQGLIFKHESEAIYKERFPDATL